MKRGLQILSVLFGLGVPVSALAQPAEEPPEPPAAGEVPPEGEAETPPEAPEAEGEAPAGEAAEGEAVEGEAAEGEAAEEAPAEEAEIIGPPETRRPAVPIVLEEAEVREGPPQVGYVPGYSGAPSMSLSPQAPPFGTMPSGLTPSFGVPYEDENLWTFKFKGYMESTVRAAIGHRENAGPDQSELVIHSIPIIPGRYGDFEATQAFPGPWVQLNFSYGNPFVEATVIIAGFSQTAGASYTYPSSQLGVNDAYLTFNVPKLGPFRLKWLVGAFQERYGAMGQYSEGNYGHSVIASTSGVGETVTVDFDITPEVVFVAEHGIKGSLGKPPIGLFPNDATAYADEQIGSSLLNHAHVGLLYKDLELGLHYLHAWSQEDRFRTAPFAQDESLAPSERPDGYIRTVGAHARLIGEPYGHFFIGGSYTKAKDARGVSRVIRILNTQGGQGLAEEYFGYSYSTTADAFSEGLGEPDGMGGFRVGPDRNITGNVNGELWVAGLQYDMSLQKFLRAPAFFNGNAPDLRASFFGTVAHVNSPVSRVQRIRFPTGSDDPEDALRIDGVTKYKVGTDLTYQFLPWFGVSGRFDHVVSDAGVSGRQFQVLSPRLIFRTGFISHEQINIRYTRWFYGDKVTIQSVAPNPVQGLDEHMFAIQGSMWW